MELLSNLLRNTFMPHGACYLWQSDLLSMHVGSDFVVAASYFSIPLFLLYVTRVRRQLELNWVLLLFGAFILLCGLTHLFSIWIVWDPRYYLQGLVKVATAAVSLVVAITLWRKLDWFLGIPSPAELENKNAELGREIRTREKLERELRRSNHDLQNFASVASHDLQEPLRAVGSYTELLRRRYRGKLDDEADEFIDFACQGAARMQRMISDLLEWSKLDRSQSNYRDVPMEQVVDETLKGLASLIESTGSTVTYQSLPVVLGDRGQLTRLVQNLIANAIKFRAEDRAPEVVVSAKRGEGAWVFSVRDNGIGMKQENTEAVFDAFRRLHSSEAYEGTGIGLAICKRVIEHRGGEIWVESTPGEGSTFFFSIPDSPPESSVDEHDTETAAKSGERTAPDPAQAVQPQAVS